MPDYYGTTGDADAYHAAHGNTAWTGSAELKAAALLRGSVYVDSLGRKLLPSGIWVTMFVGKKTGARTQLRSWPRTDAVDIDGNAIGANEIPVEVLQATYEAALREIAAPGSLMPDFTPSAQVKREKAGPWEEEYFEPAAGTNPDQPIITAILDILAPLLIARFGWPVMLVI